MFLHKRWSHKLVYWARTGSHPQKVNMSIVSSKSISDFEVFRTSDKHTSSEQKMASFKGVNHGLPAPLDSEYPEIAWGIGKLNQFEINNY